MDHIIPKYNYNMDVIEIFKNYESATRKHWGCRKKLSPLTCLMHRLYEPTTMANWPA